MPFIDQTDERNVLQQATPDANEYVPTFGETYAASVGITIDENLSNSMALNREGWLRRRQAVEQRIDQGIVDRSKYLDKRGRFDYDRLATELNDPEIKTSQQLRDERNEMLAQRRQYAESVMEKGSGIAQFLGAANAYMLDPISIATMPISMPATAAKNMSIVGRALLAAKNAAIVETATEIAIQPFVYEHKHDIESPYSYADALENIAGAAIGASVLGGVTGGIGGYLGKVIAATDLDGVANKNLGFSVDGLRRLKETIDYGRANRDTLDIVLNDFDALSNGIHKSGRDAIQNTIAQLEEKLIVLKKTGEELGFGSTGSINFFEEQLAAARRAVVGGDAEVMAFYKQARATDVQADAKFLTELEQQRKISGSPSRTKAQYELPPNQKPSRADVPDFARTQRERALLESQGIKQEFDLEMQRFNELEQPRFVDDQGEVVDAREAMKKFDEELDGLESVLTCAYG